MFRRHHVPFVPVLLGLFLLLTAGLKLFGLNVSPFAQYGWWASPPVQILAVVWEILLGIWLLSGRHRAGAWLAAVATFTVFATVSGYLGWIGQATCGCFGTVKASPWLTFCLDIAIVFSLLLLGKSNQGPSSTENGFRFSHFLEPLPSMIFIGVVFFLVCSLLAVWQFGSLNLAIAHLTNQNVAFEDATINLGWVKSGDMVRQKLKIFNLSNKPINIIGIPNICDFTINMNLQATIPPKGDLDLHFLLTIPVKERGFFAFPLVVWTNSKECRLVKATLTGIVK